MKTYQPLPKGTKARTKNAITIIPRPRRSRLEKWIKERERHEKYKYQTNLTQKTNSNYYLAQTGNMGKQICGSSNGQYPLTNQHPEWKARDKKD